MAVLNKVIIGDFNRADSQLYNMYTYSLYNIVLRSIILIVVNSNDNCSTYQVFTLLIKLLRCTWYQVLVQHNCCCRTRYQVADS